MRRAVVGTLVAMVVVAAPATWAQTDYGYRVGQEADALKRATSVLADRTMQDLMRSYNNSRSDIQIVVLARQLDAVAAMCVELVRGRRPVAEVRDVMAELTNLTRRAPSSSPQSSLWRNVQTAVDNLNRELSGGSGGGSGRERPVIGRVAWSGRVDDRVQLVVRGSSIEQRTISGAELPAGRYTFTSPLPASAVEVGVTKQSGRGSVRVLQQPARSNDFTAVIEVLDDKGGAQDYRLDIFWR
jgi:hypothetical protein